MVAHVGEELRATHEARLQEFQLEAEAKLRLIQAGVERRHKEAMVARIAHSEATHSQVVESIRGDFAAKDAANADLLVRLIGLDGRHGAMGATVVQYAQSEAVLEKVCRNLKDEIDEFKTSGSCE